MTATLEALAPDRVGIWTIDPTRSTVRVTARDSAVRRVEAMLSIRSGTIELEPDLTTVTTRVDVDAPGQLGDEPGRSGRAGPTAGTGPTMSFDGSGELDDRGAIVRGSLHADGTEHRAVLRVSQAEIVDDRSARFTATAVVDRDDALPEASPFPTGRRIDLRIEAMATR